MQLNELSASDPSLVRLNCNADFKKTATTSQQKEACFFCFFSFQSLCLWEANQRFLGLVQCRNKKSHPEAESSI